MKNSVLVRCSVTVAVEVLKGFKVVVLVVKADERKKPFEDLSDDGDDDDGDGGEGEGEEVEVRSMVVRLALLTTTPTAKSRLIRKELPPLSGIVDRLLCAACRQWQCTLTTTTGGFGEMRGSLPKSTGDSFATTTTTK